VSIGSNATISCGISIGEGATVGAGAVVTRDVPPHAIVAAVPARAINLKEALELSRLKTATPAKRALNNRFLELK
jgi:UDP-2-acetamido-3-amino-2,3-dideoxy-glucuronate N-acetyltransferase